MAKRKRRVVAIDFFCGAGGLTRGLLDSGINVLAGVDNDLRLKDTYEKNNAPSVFVHADINTVDITKMRTELGIREDDIVVYAACAPCQPFSTLNRKQGCDERKILLLAFAKLLQETPPDFIIVENVPGLNNATGREVFDKFNEMLDMAGFSARFAKELDAKNYGVAQFRKRFLLIASRHGHVDVPKRSRKHQTVRDQIGALPPLIAGEVADNIPNHKASPLLPHLLRIVQAVPKDGGSRNEIADTSILLKCHQRHPKAHKDVFGRMAWDSQAPTMTCRCLHVYCGRFVHPEQDRGLSLREAAAIQSFPTTYVFYGVSDMHIAKQIGNAVPVELARRVGCAIISSAKRVRRG